MNSWLYLTADTDLTQAPVDFWQDDTSVCRGPLDEAVAAFKDGDVHLILPMEMCSWLLTEPWPNKRRPSVQALAFAVEDQLTDDLDELHIAVGPADAQQRYPLLVIHKQRFKSLLAQLHERGLNIVSVQVDADLLPREQACVAWWDGRWIVGGALDTRLALSAQALETVKTGLPADLIELPVEGLNALLGRSQRDAINLLQGEFVRTTKVVPWRSASIALLLIFATALGFTHLRSGFLEDEAARLYAQSEQRFKTLYPDQTRIVDLSVQLKALQQRGVDPQNGHMARLVQLTEQVIGASSVEVQRMEWRASAGWTLSITAASFAELEQLRERGVQSALPISVANARQQGNRVQALLTLEDIL